jgi:hypothetical protein
MPTKFAKGNEVRVHAKKFDGEGETDELGLKWSERWLRDGHGEWCYGKTSFVFKKKIRQPQKYRIKYHEGTVMESLEADIEMAPQEDAEDEDSSEDRQDREALCDADRDGEGEDDTHPLYREEDEVDGNTGTVELDSDEDDEGIDDETVTVGGTHYTISSKRKRRKDTTNDSDGEDEEQDIKMGATVTAGIYR